MTQKAKIKEFEPFFEVLNADTTYDEKKYNISKKYYEQDIDTCVQFLKSAPTHKPSQNALLNIEEMLTKINQQPKS